MKVDSKMLTAEVRIVSVSLQGTTLVVEGMVKEIMPMTVRVSPADALQMLGALSRPARTRLAKRLPERLRALVVPDG